LIFTKGAALKYLLWPYCNSTDLRQIAVQAASPAASPGRVPCWEGVNDIQEYRTVVLSILQEDRNVETITYQLMHTGFW